MIDIEALREALEQKYGPPEDECEHEWECESCGGKTNDACGGHCHQCDKCSQPHDTCVDCDHSVSCSHTWKCRECDLTTTDVGAADDHSCEDREGCGD